MSKMSAGRFLIGFLVIACTAGTGFAVSQVLQMRSDLDNLGKRIVQAEKKAAAPATARDTAAASTSAAAVPTSTSAIPPASNDLTEGSTQAQIVALRKALDDLSTKAGVAPSGGDAAKVLASVASGDGGVAPMSDQAKDALKKAIEDTLDERDKKDQQQRVARGTERMLNRLADALKLTDQQKELLKPIFDAQAKKFADLMGQDQNMSRDERRAAMDQIRNDTSTQVKQLLTAEQAQTYDQVANQLMPGGGRGGWGGGPGGGGFGGGGNGGGGGRGGQGGGGPGGNPNGGGGAGPGGGGRNGG